MLVLAASVRADITTGLLAHWKLDETSGTTATDAMGTYNGTYVNSPTLNQTGAFGSSKAVTFASASSQCVSLGVRSSSTPDQSIAFWFNASDLSGTRNAVSWGRTETRLSPTAVRYYGDSVLAGGVNFSTTFTTSQWYHVVISQSGTTGTVYVNGVSLGNQTVQALSDSTTASSLAAYLASSNFFAGTIDDVRIYNRVLSSDDVSELAAYTGASPAKSLIWYYLNSAVRPFDRFQRPQPLAILRTR